MAKPSQGLLRVCVIATPVGDEADRALDALLATIAGRLPHEFTRAWEDAGDTSPGFAELHQADAALIWARRMPLGGEALARVQWYCQRGRPLVVLRAGGGPTFAHWHEFDSDALGIEAAATAEKVQRPLLLNPCAPSHPVLAESGAISSRGSLPLGIRLSGETEVLLEAWHKGESHPAGWTHRRGSARAFATSLGQPDDLVTPAFATLVGNALRWVAHEPR